ncbi:vWA domain-containing protein [Mycolicibacterium llatzerense]|uniref:vWA domain-containing protein n=1 Tax=Mycolicibacterium llatzerense TaxID=280871 RepID=UPI0008DCF44B|nr:VWA domain-containing protein [Mycolicibacterium llatzerense]
MTTIHNGRPAADDRYTVLPFYLSADVSGSMEPHLPVLNEALRGFRDTLAKDPVLADKVQFGVLDFSDDSNVVVPLGDFSSADLEHRQLSSRGGTNYAAAFTTLRNTIEADLTAGQERYRYYRPAVFFLTDGYPNGGDWRNAFRALTAFDPATGAGFRSYPLFVPFGIGDADRGILTELVHPVDRSQLFMANAGTSPAAAIEAMTKAMLTSILSSGRSAAAGKPQHLLPTKADVGPGVSVYAGGDFVT